MSDIYCPLGPDHGCKLKDGLGTCDTVREGRYREGQVVFCRGVGASICHKAYQVWMASGQQTLPQAPVVDPRPEPPAQLSAGNFFLDKAISSVDGNFRAWHLNKDHSDDCSLGLGERNGCNCPCPEFQQREMRLYVANTLKLYLDTGRAPNLVFLGHPGTGKTFMARIAGKVAADRQQFVRFVVFRELLLNVKACRDARSTIAEEAVLLPYVKADILIIDDIRPVFNSQDDENIIDELIKARYGEDRGEARHMTVVTSNLSRTELDGVIGAAAARRLYCDGLVHLQIFDWAPWTEKE